MTYLVKNYRGFSITSGYYTNFLVVKNVLTIMAGYDTTQECEAFIDGYNFAKLSDRVAEVPGTQKRPDNYFRRRSLT